VEINVEVHPKTKNKPFHKHQSHHCNINYSLLFTQTVQYTKCSQVTNIHTHRYHKHFICAFWLWGHIHHIMLTLHHMQYCVTVTLNGQTGNTRHIMQVWALIPKLKLNIIHVQGEATRRGWPGARDLPWSSVGWIWLQPADSKGPCVTLAMTVGRQCGKGAYNLTPS
jgi:hypothetical protein